MQSIKMFGKASKMRMITMKAQIRVAVISIFSMLSIFSTSSLLAADLFKDDAFQNYTANVENGKILFNAGGCGSCHGTADDPNVLSGGLKMDSYVGTFFTPNISNSTKGIAAWSNANFLNAMIHGVSPKKRHYYPTFPYTNYAGMKPEDALDIKAYIATLPKSDNVPAKHKISFPYNTNTAVSMWKRANFSTPRFAPGQTDQLARGKYLVETVGACSSCHTPRTTTYGIDNSKALEGGIGLTGAVAPPITAAVMNSLASPDIFTKGVLVEGKKLNGKPMASAVMRKITQQTAELSDDDRLAMFAYLKGEKVEVKKPSLEERSCSVDGPIMAVSGSDNSLESDADAFIGQYCRNCHGPGQNAVGSFPAGSLSSIAADAAFVTPGDPDSSRLMKSIVSGRMPLGSQPSPAEVARLGEWITALGEKPAAAAAPSGPPPRGRKMVERANMVQVALADLTKLDELDRPFIRYFSYRTEYNGVHPCETKEVFKKRLDLFTAGFNKMLNSVSSGPRVVVPDEVDQAGNLIVRVDIRDLGWEDYQWDVLVEAYPYGVDPNSDPTLTALTNETQSVLPIMRADWFMANSSKPAIYHALLDLPLNIKVLEQRLGIDVEKNINRGDVARAAFDKGASGVSAHNRMVERHDLPQGGYYWKSYDFAGSFDSQSLREHPHGPPENAPLAVGLESFEHDGGEMIFSLPNGLQGYYLSDAKGNRIDEGPEKIVSYQQRPKDKAPTIINGRSCLDCHADGILTKLDAMREHIKTTNKFDFDQQKFLLKMYIEQAEMDELYDRDRNKFVDSLEAMKATEVTATGTKRSIVAPGNKEIVTWYADEYESNLNIDEFAAEFDMEPEEFKGAVRRISDLQVQQLAMQKLLQLESGATIPRFEVEQQYAYLQEALTGLAPLTQTHVTKYHVQYKKDKKKKDYVADVKEVHAEQAYKTGPVAKDAGKKKAYKQIVPQYQKKEYIAAGKLELSLKTTSTNVRVGDTMSFTVTSNKDCEMQILYVESSGNVEIFPDLLIGDPWLRAGKPRHIPLKGAGEIVFDEAGHDESLIIFCSEKGLGADRLSTAAAKKIAKDSKKTSTRGITFKLAKKVEKQEGKSAFHLVSFNVEKH